MTTLGVWAGALPVRPGYEDIATRILARCGIGDEGCWLWTGALDPHGYGRIKTPDRVSTLVHRALYAALVEEPTAGNHLDHLCRRRNCCNPGHLDDVDQRTNLTRGVGRIAQLARAKHCKNGHAFTAENTGRTGAGARYCKACNVIRQRELRERRRSARAAAAPRAAGDG